MSAPILTPENFADAALITQALRDDRIAPQIGARFGEDLLHSTTSTVLAWYQHTLDAAQPTTSSRNPQDYLPSPEVTSNGIVLEATQPPGLTETLSEPLLSDSEATPLAPSEQAVVLAAMHKATRTKGYRRAANELLSRKAPSPPERVIRRIAATSVAEVRRID